MDHEERVVESSWRTERREEHMKQNEKQKPLLRLAATGHQTLISHARV